MLDTAHVCNSHGIFGPPTGARYRGQGRSSLELDAMELEYAVRTDDILLSPNRVVALNLSNIRRRSLFFVVHPAFLQNVD